MKIRLAGATRFDRAVLLLSFALSLSGQFGHAAEDGPKIGWRVDLAQAQAEAKSRNLLLWIQFTGPWCGNCRRMERGTFTHPPILVEAEQRFVPLKLRSDEHEALAQSLGLSVLPSTVIVRPNGEVVDKFEGYAEPEIFAQFLTAVLKSEGRASESVVVRTRLRSDKDSAVALAGYDPVSLLTDQKLIPGRPDLVVEHDGRVFRFANEADRDKFLKQPESFAPVNGGRCPVSQVDRGDFLTGDPRWGAVYNGHLFLFKDQTERDRFAADPERYAGVDRLARIACPHCRARATLAHRVSHRFSSMFSWPTFFGPTSSAIADPGNPAAISLSDRLTSFRSPETVLRR